MSIWMNEWLWTSEWVWTSHRVWMIMDLIDWMDLDEWLSLKEWATFNDPWKTFNDPRPTISDRWTTRNDILSTFDAIWNWFTEFHFNRNEYSIWPMGCNVRERWSRVRFQRVTYTTTYKTRKSQQQRLGLKYIPRESHASNIQPQKYQRTQIAQALPHEPTYVYTQTQPVLTHFQTKRSQPIFPVPFKHARIYLNVTK